MEESEMELPEEIEEEVSLDDAEELTMEEPEMELPEEVEEEVSLDDAEELTMEEPEMELPEEVEEEVSLDDTEELTMEEPEMELPEEIEEEASLDDVEELTMEEPVMELLEEDEDPMAALKDISAETVGSDQDSFDRLKTVSKKIIDGEAVDLGIDLKSEIGELLRIIIDTKARVDEIEPTIATSNKHLPNVLSALESVTETTEDATFSLMENADSLNNYYQEFVEEISDLEDLIYRKDVGSIVKKIEQMESRMSEADNMGFNILQALEFQDITEQKLHKVISSISDIGARLGAILGFIKLKQDQDPSIVDDASQDDIDKLLSEFGLD